MSNAPQTSADLFDGLGYELLPHHYLLHRMVKASTVREVHGSSALGRLISVIGFVQEVFREGGRHARTMVVIKRQSTGKMYSVPITEVFLDGTLTTPDGNTGKAVWLGPEIAGHPYLGQLMNGGVHRQYSGGRPRAFPVTGIVVAVHRGRGERPAYVTILADNGKEHTVVYRAVKPVADPLHERTNHMLVSTLRATYGQRRSAKARNDVEAFDTANDLILDIRSELEMRGFGDLFTLVASESVHRDRAVANLVAPGVVSDDLAGTQSRIRSILEDYGFDTRPSVDESAPLPVGRVYLSASEKHRGVRVRVLGDANMIGSGGNPRVVVEYLETVRAANHTGGAAAGQLAVFEVNRILVDTFSAAV